MTTLPKFLQPIADRLTRTATSDIPAWTMISSRALRCRAEQTDGRVETEFTNKGRKFKGADDAALRIYAEAHKPYNVGKYRIFARRMSVGIFRRRPIPSRLTLIPTPPFGECAMALIFRNDLGESVEQFAIDA